VRHYGHPACFLRLLPVIRLMVSHRNSAHGLSLVCAHHAGGVAHLVLGARWLGPRGRHPELLAGPLHRFLALVLAMAGILAALYYVFVQRAAARR